LLFKSIADDQRSVAEILQEAPKELHCLYKKLLSDIPISIQQDANQILTIVTYCQSPLLVAEVAYLSVTSTEDRLKYNLAEAPDESVIDRVRHNISRLSNLLRVTKIEQRVCLHHISEKEYLISQAMTNQSGLQLTTPRVAHKTIAMRCLERITAKSSLPFPDPYGGAASISECTQKLRKHTFLLYALKYWSYHLREATEGVEAGNQDLKDLSLAVEKFLRTWLDSTFEFRRYVLARCYLSGLSEEKCKAITGVELFSICGLTFVLRSLLMRSRGHKKESSQSPLVKSALRYAFHQGHESTVDFLLDHFNITSLDDNAYSRIVSHSAWGRNSSLLRKVLKLRKPRISELVEATLAAFKTGERNTLNAVVQDQNIFQECTELGRTALHEFICRHSADTQMSPKVASAVSAYFISQGVDPNGKDNFGFTALHYVCWSKELCTNDLVSTLITHGADPFCTTKANQTPLHFAAQFARDSSTIKLLLEATNYELVWAETRGGNTPLHWAVHRADRSRTEMIESSSSEIFKLLLTSGADSAARNKRGLTPAEYGRETGSTNYHLLNSLGQLEGPKQASLLYSTPSNARTVSNNDSTPTNEEGGGFDTAWLGVDFEA
jgi:ankyrin repeat protein